MPTYIYAITPAEHPLRMDGLQGVGKDGSALRTVSTPTLSAVVSTAPEGLRAKRRDLAAHEAVLEQLMADGAVLPMRFGLVGPDDDAVTQALEENVGVYTERLKELDGRLEYNLKVTREEEDLLREIIATDDQVRQLNEQTREQPDAHDAKVRLGELISQRVTSRQSADSDNIVQNLSAYAVGSSVSDPTSKHFMNVSFLVERNKAAAFSEAVHQDAEQRGDAYTYYLHGPLPAYSFV